MPPKTTKPKKNKAVVGAAAVTDTVKKKKAEPAEEVTCKDDDVIAYVQGLVHGSYGVLYSLVRLELKKPPSKRTWRDIEKQAGVCAGWLDKFVKAAGLDKE